MGCKSKIQVIQRANSQQFYLMIPAQTAQALELEKGEEIDWIIESKELLVIKRDKKKRISKAGRSEHAGA
jgi:antitoxin component of MazEF toxin-antitoxin module